VLISHVHAAVAVPTAGTLAMGVQPLLALAQDDAGGGGGGRGGGADRDGSDGDYVDVVVVPGAHEHVEDEQAQQQAARELEAAASRMLSQLQRLVHVTTPRRVHLEPPPPQQQQQQQRGSRDDVEWGGVRVLSNCLQQVAVVQCSRLEGVPGGYKFDAAFTHRYSSTSRSPHTRAHRHVPPQGSGDGDVGEGDRHLHLPPRTPTGAVQGTAPTPESLEPISSLLRSASPSAAHKSAHSSRPQLSPNTPLWKMATYVCVCVCVCARAHDAFIHPLSHSPSL